VGVVECGIIWPLSIWRGQAYVYTRNEEKIEMRFMEKWSLYTAGEGEWRFLFSPLFIRACRLCKMRKIQVG